MGCLIELVLEVLFEGFFEIMFAIIPKPENGMTKKKEEWLKFFVALYVLAVIVSIFVCVILLLTEGSAVGYYLIFIPVGLVLINIILNVIFKIKRKKNKK